MTAPAELRVPDVLRATLVADWEDRWNPPYSAERLARLEQAVADWSEGMQAGGIANPVFVRAKDTISRAVESAWHRLPRDRHWLDGLTESLRNAADTVPAPNLATLGGREARLKKAAAHPDLVRIVAFIQGMRPLLDAYDFLRQHTRKRGENQNEAAERYVPPPSSSAAVQRTRELLEGVVERVHAQTVEDFKAFYRSAVERFLAKAAEAKAGGEASYSPYDHLRNGRGADLAMRSFLSKVLATRRNSAKPGEAGFGGLEYYANAGTWAKSDAEAVKDAEFVRERFVNKNLRKLTSILEKKGDALFLSAEEIGETSMQAMQGRFRFRFKDGSGFEVFNSLVFVVNNFGTRFFRYPLTFHHVMLAGGSESLDNPSEARMNTVWAAQHEAPAPRRSKPAP